MAGVRCGGAVALCLVLAAAVRSAAGLSRQQRRTAVLPSLTNHPALKYLDLEFCGSGSEEQISRGPLGCGFPVPGDHPWLVALGFKSNGGNVTYSCAGALISDQFVVTSARCALGGGGSQLTSVRAGEYDFGSASDCLWYAPDQCLQRNETSTHDVIVHPKFKPSFEDGGPSLYDIALIRLAKPLVLTYGVMPICLPIFSLRQPPKSQRAIAFNLASRAPMSDSGVACCNCSRERGAISHVMDAERLMDFNVTYNGTEPCHYELLGEKTGDPPRCIGAGSPCIADMGGPMVSADRFGGAYFLMGVATAVPREKACKSQKGVSVVYLPVQPHAEWLLDSIESIAG